MKASICAKTSSAFAPGYYSVIGMPTQRQIRYGIKPLVFLLCALPLLSLIGRAFGFGDDLGPNPVETLQDVLGEWGLRFLLATLAVTPLRLLLGKPWLGQFRRMLGLFAFTYAGLHFANYLVLDQSLDLATIVEDIVERPFITVGFVAVVTMVPLAITSTAGWRRRLGKRWNALHRLVYPAAILACWHFWWQVKKDITEPLIYAAILAALLGYRIWRHVSQKTQSA